MWNRDKQIEIKSSQPVSYLATDTENTVDCLYLVLILSVFTIFYDKKYLFMDWVIYAFQY